MSHQLPASCGQRAQNLEESVNLNNLTLNGRKKLVQKVYVRNMSLYVLHHYFIWTPSSQSETLAGKHSSRMRCCFVHLGEALSSETGDFKYIPYGNKQSQGYSKKPLIQFLNLKVDKEARPHVVKIFLTITLWVGKGTLFIRMTWGKLEIKMNTKERPLTTVAVLIQGHSILLGMTYNNRLHSFLQYNLSSLKNNNAVLVFCFSSSQNQVCGP